MPMELRKRKAPEQPAPTPAPKKAAAKASKAAEKVKETVKEKTGAAEKDEPSPAEPKAAAAVSGGKPAVGDVIDLEGFGGEVETHEGEKTSLKKLADESKAGVVLFTYPKAQTGGCIKQACAFRDSYESLTSTGLSIYGLSTDSPKANTNFKDKQKLPYTLLCDPQRSLIDAIGLKTGAKTTRGVFIINKEGKVLASQPGGPLPTVDVAKGIAKGQDGEAAKTEED